MVQSSSLNGVGMGKGEGSIHGQKFFIIEVGIDEGSIHGLQSFLFILGFLQAPTSMPISIRMREKLLNHSMSKWTNVWVKYNSDNLI